MAPLLIGPDLSCVREARRWVARRCREDCRADIDPAVVQLLTSEVVTNAVVHGGAPVSVDVACTDDRVEVRVSDTGPASPLRREAGPTATSGRGMALLDTLAERWGVDRATRPAVGKTVWFLLAPA